MIGKIDLRACWCAQRFAGRSKGKGGNSEIPDRGSGAIAGAVVMTVGGRPSYIGFRHSSSRTDGRGENAKKRIVVFGATIPEGFFGEYIEKKNHRY